jgi:hypothetical protein
MSGADLEYNAMLAKAGVNPASAKGIDGARGAQLEDKAYIAGNAGGSLGGGGGIPDIHTQPAKATLEDTDELLLGDNTSGFTVKKFVGSTLKNFIKTLRLDQFAAPTADVNINSNKLTNVDDGTNPQDASTVFQMGAAVGGRMLNDVDTGLLALLPAIIIPVPYDTGGATWHAATYAAFSDNPAIAFAFIGGVDDGLHNPFATAGPQFWTLLD